MSLELKDYAAIASILGSGLVMGGLAAIKNAVIKEVSEKALQQWTTSNRHFDQSTIMLVAQMNALNEARESLVSIQHGIGSVGKVQGYTNDLVRIANQSINEALLSQISELKIQLNSRVKDLGEGLQRVEKQK